VVELGEGGVHGSRQCIEEAGGIAAKPAGTGMAGAGAARGLASGQEEQGRRAGL
jgi:hypothetical protein